MIELRNVIYTGWSFPREALASPTGTGFPCNEEEM
jgi:hypothetical protein